MIIDKDKSKVKLWVQTHQATQTWYSYMKENGKPVQEIIARMRSRILSKKLSNAYKTAIFYDNITGSEIERISGTAKTDPSGIRIRLWIGFPDIKENETWYNLPEESGLQNHEIIESMKKRILEGRHRMNFNIAGFYNPDGFLLKKITGNLVKNKEFNRNG